MRIEGFKVCNTCNIEKSTEEFHLHKKSLLGVRNTCKSCVSIERKADYYKNQERNIQYSRDYYDKYPQDKNKLKNYRETHKEENNIRHKNRRNKDIFYNLNISIRGLIKGSFKKKEKLIENGRKPKKVLKY